MKSIDHCRDDYEAAFQRERAKQYPEVTELEGILGYAVDRERLEAAARVLACPVKVNPPNWQHGRILYAFARSYLQRQREPVTLLDIGTAKGFSACVLAWAVADSPPLGHWIESVDVVEPDAFVKRNSIVECETLKTVSQFVAPFIEKSVGVIFHGGGSARWLQNAATLGRHVGFAFVDGKHSHDAVALEAIQLAKVQRPGDVILFDDVQIPEVARAVMKITGYSRQPIALRSARRAYVYALRC